jgi:hypothetical protein
MSATERQRRWRAKLRASKPGVQQAVSAAHVERLQARLRELEAENAALWTILGKHRAAMEKILLQRMGAGSRKRKASRNQRHAAARRLARELDGVTGYQRACDIIWGPAQATSASTKRAAATRAGRKRASAAT